MTNNLKKIFITGGAGYVGAMLSPRLADLGYEVVVYDLMIYGEDVIDTHPNIKMVKGDIRDTDKLKEAISRNFHDTKQVKYDNNMTIRDSLQNAHCCVAYTSGSSLDAILDGVPVIPTSQYNFVWEISSHSINDIENPKLGEREQLLYNLAYAQWSVQEIQQGKPWNHLYEYISSHNI